MTHAEVQSFPAARAFDWLGEGWRLFRLQPKAWLVAAVVSVVIIQLLSLIPRVGELLANFLALFFFGGLLLMARDVDEGRNPPLSRLFVVFQTKLVPVLLTTLLITLAVSILVFVAVAIAGGSAALGNLAAGKLAKTTGLFAAGVVVLLMVGALVVASGVFWFAPGLVVLHNARPVDAVRQSARGFVRNGSAMLLLVVMFFGLGIVAQIPLGLGWLVLLPVMSAASYASIKDVFA